MEIAEIRKKFPKKSKDWYAGYQQGTMDGKFGQYITVGDERSEDFKAGHKQGFEETSGKKVSPKRKKEKKSEPAQQPTK